VRELWAANAEYQQSKINKYRVMATANPILSAAGGPGGAEGAFESSSSRGSATSNSLDSRLKSAERVKSIEEEPNVASLFSCFVNLCNTILGSGLLGLPYGTIN
jgi:hypothetical protein